MASWSEYLKPDVIARLAAVGLHSHTAVEGTVSGLHRSPLKGVSPEFDDYREYSFGDDLKNLDWRAFARSDRNPFPFWGTSGPDPGTDLWIPDRRQASMNLKPN